MLGRMAKLEISRVHDAYAAGGECPLCRLSDHGERTYVESFRGSRVMEPAVRKKTNDTGFCPAHIRQLYAGEGKLGLALVMHTHLQESLPKLRDALEGLREAARAGRKGSQRLDTLAAGLGARRDRCYICDMLEADLDRYASTILYLWQKDPDFPPVLRASRGFCLDHFLLMLAAAQGTLRGDALLRWLDAVVPLMNGSLEQLERDLLAFTQLHHGTNRSLGTEEERSALSRALQKLSGSLMDSAAR